MPESEGENLVLVCDSCLCGLRSGVVQRRKRRSKQARARWQGPQVHEMVYIYYSLLIQVGTVISLVLFQFGSM